MLGKKSNYRILTIDTDGVIHKLYPGDKYTLNINLEFSKDKSNLTGIIPITFSWDGSTLRKIEGP